MSEESEIEAELDPSGDEIQSWGDRLLLAERILSPRQRKLCELPAQGLPNVKIAEQLGYTQSRVSILLTNTQICNEVERIREKIYEDSIGRRLRDMGRPALDELDRCLGDKSGKYKEPLKVETAKWIVEKLDGKAVQKYDVGENLLSVMMDRLDTMKRAGLTSIPAIDVTSLAPTEQIPQESGEKVPETLHSKSEEDLLDDWIIGFK